MKSADLEADGQMDAPPGFTSSALLTSTLSRWDRLGQDAGPERFWGLQREGEWAEPRLLKMDG